MTPTASAANPDWHIPANEHLLRELARKQAEYASLPVMDQRRKLWKGHNDARPARPPVIIETWTFNRDFMPAGITRCQSPAAQPIEWRLLENIRRHELIDDDTVIPDRFTIGWHTQIDALGIEIERKTVKDHQGYETGYEFIHPIKDLARDVSMLKPPSCSVDRERTYAYKAFLDDLLGDLLPVEIRTSTFGFNFLTHRVIELMGMEAFFTAMLDCPDHVHQLMAYLRDNSLSMMRWAEGEGLLRLNNENQQSFGSSYSFTDRLPAPGYTPPAARLCDMWGCANSQETVGISPALFREFCFPYYRDVCEPLGLLYYGCCEPAHPFWEDIRKLPHLKKVSISRWCDEPFMGEALRGTEIVYSRKPNPNLLCDELGFDEDAWAAHIRRTLDCTRGVFVEFIIRDVYTLHGDLTRARRAVRIARQIIDRHAA